MCLHYPLLYRFIKPKTQKMKKEALNFALEVAKGAIHFIEDFE
jgi:hypothetical protein